MFIVCFLVGSVIIFFNLLWMLYLCVGDYLFGQGIVYVEGFLFNIFEGVCLECYGLGWVYIVIEDLMVFDFSFIICEWVVVVWLQVWGGQNQCDILVMLGIDVDVFWCELLEEMCYWIFFIDEQLVVLVYLGLIFVEMQCVLKKKMEFSYMGIFFSVWCYVLYIFVNIESVFMKKWVQGYMIFEECLLCYGKWLCQEVLNVIFVGLDIIELLWLLLV